MIKAQDRKSVDTECWVSSYDSCNLPILKLSIMVVVFLCRMRF